MTHSMQRARVHGLNPSRSRPRTQGRYAVPVMRPTPLAPQSGVRSRSLRRLLPVAALGAALALSACQTQSPIQTDVPYTPADGVPVDLGAVQIRDLVVVGAAKDQPGVLTGSLVNTSSEPRRVAFGLQNGQPVFTEAPPHSQQRLSESSQVQLATVPAAPGDVIRLTVQSPGAPTTVVNVPVLPASGYYATLAPTGAPATSTR
jgi:hypothetical protein